MVLVVGAGGMIGKKTFRYFNDRFDGVCGTTHRDEVKEKSIFPFDLLNPDFDFLSEILPYV